MTPDTHTIQEFFLEATHGHSLYVHEWGNPAAKTTIINLHGGPGSSTKDHAKRRYDPLKHRLIFFDQRGSGKSLPYGSLDHNTTDDLIDDITAIADHCKAKTFMLCGSSWGSCLALAYAVKQPQRVSAMVLSGIFSGTKAEIAWLDQGMFQIFFPHVWDEYLQATPEAHRDEPSAYHFERILGDDPEAAKRSAYAYHDLEGGIVQLDDTPYLTNYDTYDPAGTRIEVHYMANHCFMPERHIQDNAAKLTMPIRLVQGRYDMVCPPLTAYKLHKALPDSRLYFTQAGHANGHETSNLVQALVDELAA